MSEVTPPSTAEMSPTARFAMAAICAATGAGIIALATGIIPLDESAFQAPRWVIGACGGVFLIAGLMIRLPAGMPRLQQFLGAVFISVFATIPAWVAFGGGLREFSGRFRW